MFFNQIATSPEIPLHVSNPFLMVQERKNISPGLLFLQALQSKHLVDEFGILNPSIQNLPINIIDSYMSRMNEFLSKKRFINIRETNLKIELSWQEILEQMAAIDPALFIEILKKDILHFLGFENIVSIFQNWGINLLDICDENFILALKNEIEKEPTFLLIHYFVKERNFAKVAELKRSILQLIETKLPFKPDHPDYIKIRNDITKALCKLKNCYYKEWIRKFEAFDLYVESITASALVAFNHREPLQNSFDPLGSLCLETEDGQTIEIEISQNIPDSKFLTGFDNMRLPVFGGGVNLNLYARHLLQGLIDSFCKNTTPIPFHPLRPENWMESLIQTVKGESCHIPDSNHYCVLKLLEKVQAQMVKHPELSQGAIFGNHLITAFKKMRIEVLADKQNTAYPAIALTIAACESLKEMCPEVLPEISQTLSAYWETLKDDGSVFFTLARALDSGIPYPLISSFLQLAALNHFQRKESVVWQNLKISFDVIATHLEFESILQFRFEVGAQVLFFQFPQSPVKAFEILLGYFDEKEEFSKILQFLTERLFEVTHEKEKDTSPFAMIKMEIEKYVPVIFIHFSTLIKTNFNLHRALALFKNFCTLLDFQEEIFKEDEKEQLQAIFPNLITKETGSEFILLILTFLASSQNPFFNQAAYEYFKKETDPSIRIEASKALCKSNLSIACNTFMRISKGNIAKTVKQELFCSLCNTLKKAAQEEIILNLDILSFEIKNLFNQPFPFDNALWLAEQLLLIQAPELAKAVSECIENEEAKHAFILKLEWDKTPQSEQKTPPQEVVKKIVERSDFNRFRDLSHFLMSEEAQLVLKENEAEGWQTLIIPALEKIEEESFAYSAPFLATCLNILPHYQPGSTQLREFIVCLKKCFLGETVRRYYKPLKLELIDKQEVLLSIMSQYKMEEEILDLVSLFLWADISLEKNTILVIALAITHLLNQPKPPIKQIVDLLHDSRLKKQWQEIPKEELAGIYLKISRFYIATHFDLAFKSYSKHCQLIQDCDQNQCRQFIDICAKDNKILEFAALTKLLVKAQPSLQKRWRAAFKALFLSKDSDFNEIQLKALEIILGHSFSTTLLKNTDLPKLAVTKLLSIKEYSPFFGKTRECALQLISHSSIESAQIASLFESLSSQSELIDKAWTVLNRLNKLTFEEKKTCSLFLLNKLKYLKSKTFFEIIENIDSYPIFDIKTATSFEPFEILLEGVDKGWKLYGSKEYLVKLNQIFLSFLHCYLPIDGSAMAKFQLNFANCLITSSEIKDHTLALSFLNVVLRDYLPRYGWNLELVKSFKKILSFSKLEICNFFKPLIDYPNFEVGMAFINKMNKDATDQNLLEIGQVLKCLIKESKQLDYEKFSHFLSFCSKLDLPKLFNKMSVLADIQLNQLVIECLSLPEIKYFCRETTDLLFNAIKNIYNNFTNMANDFKYSLSPETEIFSYFIQFLPKFLKEKRENEVNELLEMVISNNVYDLYLKGNFEAYDRSCSQLNEILHMWDTNPEADPKPFNEYFYLFAAEVIKNFHRHINFSVGHALASLSEHLKKIFQHPHLINPKSLELSLYLSYTFNELRITKKGLEEIIKKPMPDFDKMQDFMSQFYSFANRPEKERSLFEKAFLLYMSRPRPLRSSSNAIVRIKKRNKKIDFLSELLNHESSELIIKIVSKTIFNNAPEFLSHFETLMLLLRKLNKMISGCSPLMQCFLYKELAVIFRFIQKIKIKSEKENVYVKIFHDAQMETLTSMIQGFTVDSSKLSQIQYFYCFYPIVLKKLKPCIEKNLNTRYPIFENSLSQYMQMGKVCLQFTNNQPFFKKFVEEAHRFLSVLRDLSPAPKNYQAQRAFLFNKWIRLVIELAENKFDVAADQIAFEVYLKGFEKGIYNDLPYDEKLIQECIANSEFFLSKRQNVDAHFEELVRSLVQILEKLKCPSVEALEKRAEALNHWLLYISQAGQKLNKPRKTKELIKKILAEALKSGIYKNFDTAAQTYRQALNLIL